MPSDSHHHHAPFIQTHQSHDYWEPQMPHSEDIGDHEVPLSGNCLAYKKIALLVTGGIAAFKAPLLARELRKYGAEVTVFASHEALRYVTADALAWSSNHKVIQELTHRAEHLGDGEAFDAYLMAPATYNSINKARYGIADSLISTVMASALGRLQRRQTQVLIAPTMHGTMHNGILEESLIALQEIGVTVIPPRDAYGKHNLPSEQEIVYRTARALSDSVLRNQPILVTGGPTPVAIDGIRRISTRFSGELGCEIAKALFAAGADVHWIHGISSLQRPDWLPCQQIEDFDEYYSHVMQTLDHAQCVAGIFSAAVADYRPIQVEAGKIPSGQNHWKLEFKQTPKVIQDVRLQFPYLQMVTFKFESGLSHEALMQIAQDRLEQGYQAVVANRQEELHPEHIAWLVSAQGTESLSTKAGIAAGIVNYLESVLYQPEDL